MISRTTEGRSLLSILNAMVEALSLSDEPLGSLGLALDILTEFLATDCCWIQVRDKNSGALTLAAHRGLKPEMVAEILSPKIESSLANQVATTKQPIVIADLATDTRYSLMSFVRAGQHSLAVVPMKSKRRVEGVIGVSSSTTGKFNEKAVELLSALGNHISVALDKANLYQQAKEREKELLESETKFRTLFEEANDAIFLTDATTGHILDANREAERLLGRPRREIIGMHQSQLHPKDKTDYYNAVFRHHAEVRNAADIEAEVVRKDGTIVPVFISTGIVQLQGRKLVQGVFKDIAEYKRTGREIRVKDSAMDSSINAIALADLQGNLTYVNRSFLKLWGYDDEQDILGKHATKFWLAEEKAEKVLQALLSTGSWTGELVALRKDDSTFDAHLSVSIVNDEAGKPICLMGSFIDITQRKLNEAQILEQSRRLNAISQLARVISSDLDINEIFESFAQQLRKMLDFDRISVNLIEEKKVILFAVSPAAVTETGVGTDALLDGSATGWVAKHKRTLILPDTTQNPDKIKTVDGLASSIHIPLFHKGQVFGSLSLSSARANAFGDKEREVMEQLAAQIGGAIQNANLHRQERAHLLELEKQKQEWLSFTGIVAHELKTPLTSIIAGAELLSEELQGKAPELEQRLMQNIVHSAHTLDTSLDELLDLTKIRSLMQVQLAPTNIKELVDEVLEYIRPIMKRKEQALALNLADTLPLVNADAQRMAQVFRNLLMNAVKFTPAGGNIALRARQQNRNLLVEVQDSGIGIAKEKQTGLFERYYRAESDREHFPGMGLGLALSKQIIELHGGRIWVDSAAGKGSTFSFSLPL